jgi:hypothetical protein
MAVTSVKLLFHESVPPPQPENLLALGEHRIERLAIGSKATPKSASSSSTSASSAAGAKATRARRAEEDEPSTLFATPLVLATRVRHLPSRSRREAAGLVLQFLLRSRLQQIRKSVARDSIDSAARWSSSISKAVAATSSHTERRRAMLAMHAMLDSQLADFGAWRAAAGCDGLPASLLLGHPWRLGGVRQLGGGACRQRRGGVSGKCCATESSRDEWLQRCIG